MAVMYDRSSLLEMRAERQLREAQASCAYSAYEQAMSAYDAVLRIAPDSVFAYEGRPVSRFRAARRGYSSRSIR